MATVTGVFCDGWVIPDSNGFFFCDGVGCSGFFLRQFTFFFFATVLAAEVFVGVSQRSTVEEEEKESRRMRSRGEEEEEEGEGAVSMAERSDGRGLIASIGYKL